MSKVLWCFCSETSKSNFIEIFVQKRLKKVKTFPLKILFILKSIAKVNNFSMEPSSSGYFANTSLTFVYQIVCGSVLDLVIYIGNAKKISIFIF